MARSKRRNANNMAQAAARSIVAGARTGRSRVSSQGVGQQHCVVKSSRTVDLGSTDSTGAASSFLSCDPFNIYWAHPCVTQIAGSYEYYRVRSCSVEFNPTSGSAAAGALVWAFIDNPEIATAFQGAAYNTRVTILGSADGVESIAIGYPAMKTYRNNRVQSRQWFQCNDIASGVSDYDRSVWSSFVWYAKAAATAPLGRFTMNCVYEFSGLGNAALYTLRRLSLADGDSVVQYPYGDTGAYPESITLKCRELGEQEYHRVDPDNSDQIVPAPVGNQQERHFEGRGLRSNATSTPLKDRVAGFSLSNR